MTSTLELLLTQLRDGPTDPAILARARGLVRDDERIPADVREIALLDPDEAAGDAAGLLAVLGSDDLGEMLADAIRFESDDEAIPVSAELDGWAPIGEALREGLLAEADGVEVANVVLRRLPVADFPWGPVLAGAIVGEAGAADVSDQVLAEVTGEIAQGAPVVAAILAEAGSIDVADRVVAELGLSEVPVRLAVLAEAGSVDVVAGVLERVGAIDAGRAARSAVELATAPSSAASSAAPVPPTPIPANSLGWAIRSGVVGFLVAAVTLLVVGVWGSGGVESPELLFAHADDVIIEDLSYGDDVQVLQIEGDDGAVILWVDEEA